MATIKEKVICGTLEELIEYFKPVQEKENRVNEVLKQTVGKSLNVSIESGLGEILERSKQKYVKGLEAEGYGIVSYLNCKEKNGKINISITSQLVRVLPSLTPVVDLEKVVQNVSGVVQNVVDKVKETPPTTEV